MPKKVEITPEVRAVLTRGRAEGDAYFLPAEDLGRELYMAVNKVLAALGGKWDRSSRSHLFKGGLGEQLTEALESGVAVDRKRTAEQFFTPPEVAAMVAERACIQPGMKVLEPSAGDGALVQIAVDAGANVYAYETDEALRKVLLGKFFPQFGAGGLGVDFLEGTPTPDVFDRVVMNPPFGSGADMIHVARALSLLRPGGILVAIMSPHWTFAADSRSQGFRGLLNDHSHDWEPLPEGSFKSAGTGVRTGILTIRKGNI